MTQKSKENLPVIDSIDELVESVELRDVEFYELSARSKAGFGDDVGADEDLEPVFELRVQHRDQAYRIRLRVSIALTLGDVVADIGAVYELNEEARIPTAIGLEFANRVGVMALLPYVRESVHTLTTKVFGQALLMPVMRAGQLQFEADTSESIDAV